MSFQIAVSTASQNMVISVGPLADHTFAPGTDFGAEFPIVTVEDDAQYQTILANPVTYYDAGTHTVTPQAPA